MLIGLLEPDYRTQKGFATFEYIANFTSSLFNDITFRFLRSVPVETNVNGCEIMTIFCSCLVSYCSKLPMRYHITIPYIYTLQLHPSTTPYNYTIHLHPTITPLIYTLQLHPSTTTYNYTIQLHHTTTPYTYNLQLTLQLHHTTTLYNYTLQLHSTTTLYNYTLQLHPTTTPI